MYKRLKDFFWILLKATAVIEVILGLIWIIFNITGFYEDSIAFNYIAASKTLVIDDYMGLGYAILVGIFGHGSVMYIFQLLVLLIVFMSLLWIVIRIFICHITPPKFLQALILHHLSIPPSWNYRFL